MSGNMKILSAIYCGMRMLHRFQRINCNSIGKLRQLCGRVEEQSLNPFSNTNKSEITSQRLTLSKFGKGEGEGGEIVTKKKLILKWFADIVSSSKTLNCDEWDALKQTAVTQWSVPANNFESQAMLACCLDGNYSLGKSLMLFIRRDGRLPNVVCMSKYLRLCADSPQECDETLIWEVYDEMCKRQAVFDSLTVCDIVHGLGRTSRWREAIPHADSVLLTCSFWPIPVYEDLAKAAFVHGDCDYGWKLLEELHAKYAAWPSEKSFLTWIDVMKTAKTVNEQKAMLEKMLRFMHSYAVVVSLTVAKNIKSLLESRTDEEWHGAFTTVTDNGVCNACNRKLQSIRLNEVEFDELRSNFIAHVIEGQDIYLKTNPRELDKFKRFVSRTAPYCAVLDGLNIAFAKSKASPVAFADQLLKMVREVKGHIPSSRKLLVLGRHHMGRWSKATMREIEESAHVFFAENITKDDPFMIYAAMYSGQGTYFISHDMMRDHLFCLKEPRLKQLFRQWQRGHQLNFSTSRSRVTNKIHIQPPLCHNPVAQAEPGCWHIPYDDGTPKYSYETGNSWLCLSSSAIVPLSKPATITVSSKSKINVHDLFT